MNYNKCLEYLGYYAMIEYSAEDESFIGKILGITDTLVFDGTTIDELKQQFHDTVDDYLSLYANTKSVTNVEAHFYLGKISSNPLHTSFEETNSVTKEINYVGLKQ